MEEVEFKIGDYVAARFGTKLWDVFKSLGIESVMISKITSFANNIAYADVVGISDITKRKSFFTTNIKYIYLVDRILVEEDGIYEG